MTVEELKKIISEGENAKVDFKREWYKDSTKDELKSEFIKDMFALTNGDIYSIGKTAYLIIGVTDGTKEIFDFDKSKISPPVTTLTKLTRDLLQNLNNYAQPEFLNLDIEWYKIEEDKKVLVLSVKPHDRLISLSKDLKFPNKKTVNKGTVFYRMGESIRVASADVVKDFEKAYEKNKSKDGVIINQTHSGSGDNIARDKIIYQK